MQRWLCGLGLSLAFGVAAGLGCAAGGGNPPGASGSGASGGTGGGEGGSGFPGTGGAGHGGAGGVDSCATLTAEAKQAPAAMLFVLDASASMGQMGKWQTAQLAVVQAIDNDAFDTMSLGLSTFPSHFVPMPACLCEALGGPGLCEILLPDGVACGYPVLPQVPLTPAGADKSNAPQGVRKDMYQYLVSKSPQTGDPSDASPIYDSLRGAYEALRSYSIDKRIAVLITDGGFSCTSLSSPARPGYSDGVCDDWEYPDTVNQLIGEARLDPGKPVFTFVVGVPGSGSHGEQQGSYATAPYSMKLALSTYAVSGSPETVDPACDKEKVFEQNGADPLIPCHFDLSSGAAFNTGALAAAIGAIGGKALGCVYDLPEPPPGETIDLGLVNVRVTVNGDAATIPKRSNPSDDCSADGCWDYSVANQVQLLGKACADVSAAVDAKVEIFVGCATVVK